RPCLVGGRREIAATAQAAAVLIIELANRAPRHSRAELARKLFAPRTRTNATGTFDFSSARLTQTAPMRSLGCSLTAPLPTLDWMEWRKRLWQKWMRTWSTQLTTYGANRSR